MLTPMRIAGIGTAVPAGRMSQEVAAARAIELNTAPGQRAETIRALHRRAGVGHRHAVILDGEQPSFYAPSRGEDDHGPTTRERMERFEREAANLAEVAIRAALAKAVVMPAAIAHLITVSCTGFSSPGFDIEVARRLGMRATVARTHVGFMGCHGMMNALRVAHAACAADPTATVLACAVELCSLHQQVSADPGQIVANALFADGAAAIVGRAATEGDAGVPRDGDGAVAAAAPRLLASHSAIIPDTADLMTWRIGNSGFQMHLDARVPSAIAHELRPALCAFLDARGLGLRDIGSWAVHPGGPRILQAVSESLELQPADLAASRDILARFGNMSSPTILFILDALMRSGAKLPCMMLAFGPGLTVEAALVG